MRYSSSTTRTTSFSRLVLVSCIDGTSACRNSLKGELATGGRIVGLKHAGLCACDRVTATLTDEYGSVQYWLYFRDLAAIATRSASLTLALSRGLFSAMAAIALGDRPFRA